MKVYLFSPYDTFFSFYLFSTWSFLLSFQLNGKSVFSFSLFLIETLPLGLFFFKFSEAPPFPPRPFLHSPFHAEHFSPSLTLSFVP